MQRLVRPENPPVISPDVEAALSHIESGCIAAVVGDEPAFFYKCSAMAAESLARCEKLLLEIEAIPRAEFPAARLHFELFGSSGKGGSFDCLIGLDSEEELKTLESIKEKGRFLIVYADDGGRLHPRRVGITAREKMEISKVLEVARALNRCG